MNQWAANGKKQDEERYGQFTEGRQRMEVSEEEHRFLNFKFSQVDRSSRVEAAAAQRSQFVLYS